MFTDCCKTFLMRIFHFLCELASFTVTDLQASIYLGLHLEHRTSNQDRQAHTEYIAWNWRLEHNIAKLTSIVDGYSQINI